VSEKVVDVLEKVTAAPHDHHLGRPYVTAYQLAITLDSRYPEVARELRVEIGGADIGRHTSLAQYLARELSRRIAREGDAGPIEGAFLSSDHIAALEFVDAGGGRHTSSLTGTGFPLSMFRRRDSHGR
jgi:hypothetical protein